MSSEKARRWTLHGEAMGAPRAITGPTMPTSELVEVAEVSALRAEWEEELLQRVNERTAAPSTVGFTDGYQRGRSDERQAWLAAIKEERDRG